MGKQPMLTNLGSSVQRSLMTFRLERQIYALPIEPIVQIVEMVAITPIPQVNHAVEGVVNYHGVTVPVINLRRCLGLPAIPFGLEMHIVIVETGGRTVGLIVDQVLDVLLLANGEVARPDAILPQGLNAATPLQGVVHTGGGTVLVLDPDGLFSCQQAQSLVDALDISPKVAVVGGASREPQGQIPIPENTVAR